MNKNHTNEPNYTKLGMPRQLVLPLDYGILIKETAPVRLLDVQLYTRYINESISQLMEAIGRRDILTINEVFYMCKRP